MDASDARRELAERLLRIRMQEAVRARESLERALEMSRSFERGARTGRDESGAGSLEEDLEDEDDALLDLDDDLDPQEETLADEGPRSARRSGPRRGASPRTSASRGRTTRREALAAGEAEDEGEEYDLLEELPDVDEELDTLQRPSRRRREREEQDPDDGLEEPQAAARRPASSGQGRSAPTPPAGARPALAEDDAPRRAPGARARDERADQAGGDDDDGGDGGEDDGRDGRDGREGRDDDSGEDLERLEARLELEEDDVDPLEARMDDLREVLEASDLRISLEDDEQRGFKSARAQRARSSLRALDEAQRPTRGEARRALRALAEDLRARSDSDRTLLAAAGLLEALADELSAAPATDAAGAARTMDLARAVAAAGAALAARLTDR